VKFNKIPATITQHQAARMHSPASHLTLHRQSTEKQQNGIYQCHEIQ